MGKNLFGFNLYQPHALLVVISGPSGVGKDAILKSLQKKNLPFYFVVTATTREARAGEIDGVDYFFVSETHFKKLIANDELIEYALVYNQYKGVPKEQVNAALQSGKDVIMRLDVQGAAKVRSLYPEAILIFVVPSNDEEWLQRLKDRKTETEENLKLRLATAQQEMKHLKQFDYVVVNEQDRLEEAVANIVAIIIAEHHRVNPRQIQQDAV